MHAILTLIALTIPAAHADPCATWGEITPESTSLVLGDSKEFFISGGDACGDVDACTWWLDENEGLGELSAESGSPVEWFSPETLEDCQQAVFRLYVECPAVDGGGSQIDDAEITLNCTEDDKSDLREQQAETSVGGGGCLSPQVVASLLFIPAFGLRRRRED